MSDDESPGLGLDLPDVPGPGPKPSAGAAYRVLARKYRPQTFAELIGQDAMVQTLANAIKRERIAHAFLLTGVRGVGKTSTARLIAKALNCIGPDGTGGPTIDPCGVCDPCRAIAEGRYIDVVEIDAASNNGVDHVRELTEAVRYASVSARYKMYIIDEVHMMSKPAFNALLKTLEEPPEHVKFLLATTEVDKVPVTVLSRCQRFDLRRIPADKLAAHFAAVSAAEQVAVEPEALAMIAKAAEGSARDGLSLLDQAIAHGAGTVSADQVRDMLGLADRGRIRRMLQLVLSGDDAAALAELDEAHMLGIDPIALFRGLMEALHTASRAKAGGASALPSAEEREDAETMAARLSWAQIHRLWQMLLKGLGDIDVAPDPQEAAAMALLRLIHAADLPDPGALMARLTDGQAPGSPARPGNPGPAASAPTASAVPVDFPALVHMLDNSGKRIVSQQLHDQIGLVRYAPPELILKPLKPLGPDWARDLGATLKALTGAIWNIRLADEPSEPSLLEQDKIAADRVRADVLADPNVQAVLDAFPDATLETFAAKGS